jgi:hypothetical protein
VLCHHDHISIDWLNSMIVEWINNGTADSLTALYTLERLANDNPGHRQTIVNIICAYLRMPWTPPIRNARFVGATFTGGAWFEAATFTGDAWFAGATFTWPVWFGGATFTEGAVFKGVSFGGKVSWPLGWALNQDDGTLVKDPSGT